jgi:heterodisulfide reductase subunit C
MEADFGARVQQQSGQDLSRCYYCQKCTAGCPTAYAMDVQPAQIIKMVQLGLKDDLLRSAALWLCVGCEACGTRCPNGIAVAPVIDALKQMALAEGVAIGEARSLAFHRSFVDSIRLLGRVHEASMLAEYKLRSLDLWSDLLLGIRMFRHGKLKLLPRRVARLQQVRAALSRSHGPEDR